MALVMLFVVGTLLFNSQEPEVIYSTGISVINENNINEVIGLADYVFIAQVLKKGKSYEEYTAYPVTKYNLKVLENLKGTLKIKQSIDVIKDGGVTADGKYLILNEGDFMPKEGGYYIFMGAAQSNGSLFITSQTELKNISSKSDISLSNEVEELKEAVKNEVEFERIRYQSKHEE
jgi:hypothetical protein